MDESSEDDRKEEKILPNKKEYVERYDGADDAAPGWDAIDAALKKIYPNTEARHYGTIIKFMLGGKDPLDGISIYDNSEQEFHRHVVSYGMSDLYYDPDSADKEFSGWGCEFTMRVVPFADDKDVENKDGSMAHNEPRWVINLMQNIARYVYDTGNYFEAYHFMPANSPIRLESDTKLVGIIMAPDPQLGGMDTVHGRVEFLQMVGVTQKELDWLCEEPTVARGKMLVDRMRQDNPLLLTDLKRVKEYV